MFRLFESPQPTSILGGWSGHLGNLNQVVGFSRLGHVFLHAEGTDTFAVLHPFNSALKKYSGLKNTAAFAQSVLNEPTFISEILRPHDLAALEVRLGALTQDQVYFPVPYPFVGGSGELSTYDKGDFEVFVNIVAQMHGHTSVPAKSKAAQPWWRFGRT